MLGSLQTERKFEMFNTAPLKEIESLLRESNCIISHVNCRFQVKKKQFFQNFATIMLFGVIGVFISFTVITIGE